MSDLYNRISELCEQKSITGYKLCKDIGISPSVITDLKKGRKKSLSADYAERIATYFGVTVSYLLGAETKKAPTTDGEDLADYLQDLRERPETRALLEASRGMTTEQVEQMAAFAKALRGGG